MRYTKYLTLLMLAVLISCKDKPQAFDIGDNATFEAPASRKLTEAKNTKQSNPIPTRPPSPQETATRSTGDKQIAGSSLASNDIRGNTKNRFWDKRNIYFFDSVGGTGDLVYEEIKGQPFYTNTLILVYTTDTLMEGTAEYARIEDTMKSTRLDNRIFIWVHIDEDRNVLFVKKLISENIQDDMEDANFIL